MYESDPGQIPDNGDFLEIPEEVRLQFPQVAEIYEALATDFLEVVDEKQSLQDENTELKARVNELEEENEFLRARLSADESWDQMLEIAKSAVRNRRSAERQKKLADDQHKQIIDLKEAVLRAENTDPLTELLNSRGLEQAYNSLAEQKAYRRRDYEQSTILFLDLDKFKLVNDTLGHFIGDETLKTIAGRLQERLREDDIIGRKGGDEFVIILPFTSSTDAFNLAEQLRILVSEVREINGLQLPPEFGISIGVSPMDPRLSFAGSASMANHAMKAAKAEGRNRVIAVDSAGASHTS